MNRPQKVILLSSVFPPQSGGPAIFTNRFSHWLTLKGIPNLVIAYGEVMAPEFTGNLKLVPLGNNRFRSFFKMVTEIYKNSDRETVVIANGCFLEIYLATLMQNKSYIVKIPGDPVWEIAKNKGLTNLSISDFQSAHKNLKLRILRELFNLSFKRAKYIIAPSEQLSSFLIKWGITNKKIKIIYNSVDPFVFSPSLNTRKEFDVICVSRLVKWKGLEEVIHACGYLGLKLAIVGEGPLKKELVQLAEVSNCQVLFLGNMRNTDIVEKLNSSRIYVLNSQFEATSYSLIEAKMCCLPIVARASEGTRSVINSEWDGLLCNIGDDACLIESLTKILNNPDLGTVLGKNAREDAIKRFNQEINFSRILEITGIKFV